MSLVQGRTLCWRLTPTPSDGIGLAANSGGFVTSFSGILLWGGRAILLLDELPLARHFCPETKPVRLDKLPTRIQAVGTMTVRDFSSKRGRRGGVNCGNSVAVALRKIWKLSVSAWFFGVSSLPACAGRRRKGGWAGGEGRLSRRARSADGDSRGAGQLALRSRTGYLAADRVVSSVGRALRLHRRCREFEPLTTHQPPFTAPARSVPEPVRRRATGVGRGSG